MEEFSPTSCYLAGTNMSLLAVSQDSPGWRAFGGEESGANKRSQQKKLESKRKFKVPTWDAKDEFYSYKEEVLLLPPSKEEFNETIKYKFYD